MLSGEDEGMFYSDSNEHFILTLTYLRNKKRGNDFEYSQDSYGTWLRPLFVIILNIRLISRLDKLKIWFNNIHQTNLRKIFVIIIKTLINLIKIIKLRIDWPVPELSPPELESPFE